MPNKTGVNGSWWIIVDCSLVGEGKEATVDMERMASGIYAAGLCPMDFLSWFRKPSLIVI